jgi:hypothetical protein
LPFKNAPQPRSANANFSAAHECDLRGKHGVLAHERLGAVDGIDQPKIFRIETPRDSFLTEKSIGREALFENFPNRRLAAHVCLRHRRLIGLDAHFDIVSIHRARYHAGLRRGVERSL